MYGLFPGLLPRQSWPRSTLISLALVLLRLAIPVFRLRASRSSSVALRRRSALPAVPR